MKITMILLTAVCITASANGFTQGVTLSMKNAPLESVFSTIEKQAGYYFTYTKELLQGTKNVDVNVKNASIKEVMDLCVKDQPITYEIIDKAIIIKKRTQINDLILNSVETPPLNIHGRVVDETGKPVPGVTVTVKGTSNRTATNDNGEFNLKNVSDDAVLVFTSVNMDSFEWKVLGQSEVSINLKTKVSTLGGIEVRSINTGYQTLTKERATGSAFVIDSALFNRTVSSDILSRLEGIAPGLLFTQKSTGSPSMQIRGISTIGLTGSPLIVVDNFPYYDDLNNINPNDVENITILKDAAAASVWGAKAGNGVIVITTKKGKYNQPFNLTVTSSLRLQEKPNLFYYPQMNSSDFIDVEQFLFSKGFYDADLNNTTSYPVVSPVVEILARQRSGKISAAEATDQINALRSLDVRNDYEKYVYRAPISWQNYFNFSGGTNQIKYGLSLGIDRGQTNVKNDGTNTRYTINSNTSFKPFRFLEFTLGLGLTQTESNQTGSAPSYPIRPGGGKNNLYPYAQLADALGNPLPVLSNYRMSFVDTAGSGKLLDWHYKPLDELSLGENSTKNQGFRLNFGSNVSFAPWLNGNVIFGYNLQNSSTNGYSDPGSYSVRSLFNQYSQINGGSVITPIPNGGILNIGEADTRTYNLRGQLNFNKSWTGKHSLTAMVAGEVGENKSGSSSNRFYGYNKDVLSYSTAMDYNTLFPLLTGGTARIENGDRYSEGLVIRNVDLLTNVSYTYLGRYTFYGSARKDGANVLGASTNNKWKPLWSIGAGWDISKENFYDLSWLQNLKLRASYGYTGNTSQRLSGLLTLGYGSNSPYTQLPTAGLETPPNPNLRWEQVRIINLGLDFTTFHQRISGSIDWFQKYSTDVIAPAPIDPTTGVRNATINYADIKGHGVEVVLNSRNISTRNFQWTTSLNYTYNKAIISKYYGGFQITPIGNGLNPREGGMAYAMYSYKWMGLDPATGDPRGWLNKSISKDYGSIMADSFQNQVFNGSSVPLHYGNIINSFYFKGFSISFNITYKFDYYFRKSALSYNALFTGWTGHLEYNKRWQKSGDEVWTKVPSMVYPYDYRRDNFYAGAEINVERADNIRLENIRFGLPAWENKGNNKFPVKTAQLSFIPANLNVFIWKASKSGLDPDYSGTSFLLPPAKVWAVSLNVNFK